jgi:hypothetical protein
MMRPSVIVVSMSMLAACGGLAYLHSTRDSAAEQAEGVSKSRPDVQTAEPPAPAAAAANTAAASANAAGQASPNSGDVASSETAAAPPETIAQWIKDTQSTDAKVRAAAIAALADAPKSLAMPALKRVLETGEPNVDRHIALRSMYSIALRDGDPNEQVRNTMRHAIYHGDDDAVTQTAQSLLDDIEAEFSQRQQNSQ